MKPKRTPRRLVIFCVAFPLLAACGGGRDRHSVETDTGTDPGTDPMSLAGIWDIYGFAGETAGEIEVAPGYLRITFEKSVRTELLFTESDGIATTVWTNTGRDAPVIVIDTTHVPARGDYGALPLNLSGTWGWSRNMRSCDATVNDGTASLSCVRAYFYGMPSLLPRAIRDPGAATQISRSSSIFGDLGGAWSITYGGIERCTATFVGRSFTCDCRDNPSFAGLHGYVEVHFADGLASGMTGDGREFAAIRRR